ncbi:MAG: L,D-transpeptidase [Candidatus Nanopelagicales bacterium]
MPEHRPRFGSWISKFSILGLALVVLIGIAGWVAISARSADAATPEPESTATELVLPTPVVTPVPTHAPRAASRTHKAKWVPVYPNDRKHAGQKRVVYDKALMTVWLIKANDEVVAQYPVVGRFDRPRAGEYHVFSKSPVAYNPNSRVTFNHMVRFTYGPDTKSPIGLHSIPRYYNGKRMHSVKQLGLAIARGGCVRLSEQAAAHVYKFAHKGTLIVVLPSP